MACLCPPGYSLLADGITCEKITYADPVPPTTGVPIAQNLEGGGSALGNFGLLIHENITSNLMGGTRQWPLIDTPQSASTAFNSLSVLPNVGPNWTSVTPPLLAGDRHDRVTMALPGGFPPIPLPTYPVISALRESVVIANVLNYGVGNPVLPTIRQNSAPWNSGAYGPAIGVWPNDLALTNFKWVGLSKCISVTEETTMYVLMSCNNAFRLIINGQLALERTILDSLTTAMGYVNAFPITFQPGTHTLYFEGFNYSGGGGFLVDLLECTEAELLGITTLADINNYRIFSSLWRRSRPISFAVAGNTITSIGLFTPNDVGAFVDAPGYSTTAYITQVIDANTAIISEVLAPLAVIGTLFFYWDTGDNIANSWTCPNGYLFGNCNGPECRLVETAECTEEPPLPCYLLTACDGSIDPFIVSNDLSTVVGQVINLCPANIPSRIIGPDSGVPIILSPQTDNLNNYTLVDCCGRLPNVTISNGLTNIGTTGTIVVPSLGEDVCWTFTQDPAFVVTNVIDLTDALYYLDCPNCNIAHPCAIYPVVPSCTCFEVDLAPDCIGAIILNLPVIPVPYVDCAACTPVCYLLTNCEEPTETILTFTDLSAYVGDVIKLLETCPDKCWTISIAPDCEGAISVQQSVEVFTDCATCLPPIPEVPFNLNTRAVRPGFYTAACPPEYVVNVNCRYSDIVYSQMLVKRYGISPCCDEEDVNKWKLAKQILDLKSLYDPSLCKCTITRCCPPTCLEASIIVFRPAGCPAPTNLDASIIVL